MTQFNKIHVVRLSRIQTAKLSGHALKTAYLINNYRGNHLPLRQLAKDLERQEIPVSGLANLRDAGAVEIEVTAL